MSKERKAELQRKLAMTAVPRPPADLLDRIKADIPADVGMTPERDPVLWRSTLVMRVAASLMLLVTTGLVTWRVLQPDVRPSAPVTAQRERIVPAITRSVTRPAEEKVEAPPVAETASRVQASPIVVPQSVPVAAPAKPAASMVESAEADEVRDFAALEDSSVTQTAVMESTRRADAADSRAERAAERITVTAGAPAVTEVAASAPASAPLPPPPPPPAMAAQRTTIGKAARKELASGNRGLFGVSVDRPEFARVQQSLAAGQRPADVDVEAIINHFAMHMPSAESPFLLTTELTSAPMDPERLLLRVSVDTGKAAPTDAARLSVTFSSDAIVDARRLGRSEALTTGFVSKEPATATLIYELTPRATLPREAVVATVELEWPAHKNSVTIIADQASAWSRATRRHRLSTLAGLWAESLAQPSTNPRLESLARQLQATLPDEGLITDLEKAIEASVRLPR